MLRAVTRFAEPLLAVHGGAGALERGGPAPAEEAEARRALDEALHAGMARLRAGGSAFDAVVEAVAVLEDHPRFNAGRGSALTAKGRVEMDASVMDGATRAAGGVACVRSARNPVRLARLVLERTPHVLLVGAGAEAFARAAGVPREAPEWFVVPEQVERLRRARRRARRPGHAKAPPGHAKAPSGHGTVGAVARDAAGHLAAATSTGGLVNQLPGRVGDSPLAGAGTWADDATCAVSATGSGEALIRVAFAHEVDAGVRLGGLALAGAVHAALARLTALGASGGCIALAREGAPVLAFTSAAMWRGWLAAEGEAHVALLPEV
jgi:isoaspartyl peptidase/L-asparaginase-like protein (Ntn-hydrolase superfamily)